MASLNPGGKTNKSLFPPPETNIKEPTRWKRDALYLGIYNSPCITSVLTGMKISANMLKNDSLCLPTELL